MKIRTLHHTLIGGVITDIGSVYKVPEAKGLELIEGGLAVEELEGSEAVTLPEMSGSPDHRAAGEAEVGVPLFDEDTEESDGDEAPAPKHKAKHRRGKR